MAVFLITDAGRAAATAAQIAGIQIEVAEIALGTGQYTPLATATALSAEAARFGINEATDIGTGSISVSGLLRDPVDAPLVFSADTISLAANAEIRDPVLRSADGLTTYTRDTDYTADEPAATITRLTNGAIAPGATVKADWRYYFPIGEIGIFLSDGTLFAVGSDPTERIGFKSASIPGIPIEVQLNLVGLPAENITVTTSGTALNLFNAEKDLSSLTLHFTHAANHVRLSTALASRGIYA